MNLIKRAIQSYNAYRARRKLDRSLQRTCKTLPEIAQGRQKIIAARMQHKSTRALIKSQEAAMTALLRGGRNGIPR